MQPTGGSRAVTPRSYRDKLELARKMTTGVQLWTVFPVIIHLLKQATVKAFKGSMQADIKHVDGCVQASANLQIIIYSFKCASHAMFR